MACFIKAFFIVVFNFFCSSAYSKCLTKAEIWQRINVTNDDTTILNERKLLIFIDLKKQFEECGYTKDSVYGRILERIGLTHYNINRDLNEAIKFTEEATHLYAPNGKPVSKDLATNTYFNLAFYYEESKINKKAIAFFDSVILFSTPKKVYFNLINFCRYRRCILFFLNGDYQKVIDESSLCINDNAAVESNNLLPAFYNQRAQSYFFIGKYQPARADAGIALKYSHITKDYDQIATSLKVLAMVNSDLGNHGLAMNLFNQSISNRIKSENLKQISDDYIDFGNYLVEKNTQFTQGKKCYLASIKYATLANDKNRVALAFVDLGQTYFRESKYDSAAYYYDLSVRQLIRKEQVNFYSDLHFNDFSLVDNKELVLVLLGNKIELLLKLFERASNKIYLDHSIATCLLTDSVITSLRHEQVSDQSKLYWRNKTREFYTNAMEACWLANDISLAFYFMEKSRSVLLNDKLNELGAAMYLPPQDAAKEQSLQIKIISEQKRLNSLELSSPEFAEQKIRSLNAKDDLEHFVNSLEQKFPAYYQYKYANNIDSLSMLQSFLGKNKQQFIHYFINDTAVYFLFIKSDDVRFFKLSKKDFSSDQLKRFVHFCSDRNLLNTRYSEFAQLSNSIYLKLFEPLHAEKGRVIICPDNYLVPFEALSSAADGKYFLINDYSFSYVYSASFLMKKFNRSVQDGNFLGIAPGSFNSTLNVPELKNSTIAIKNSADFFSATNVFTGADASRKNFIAYLPKYAVVNIFSHAYADSTDNEPLLYLQDAAIRLSELDLINNAATQLVILSACETNVGKNATGEGVYSLARGFSSLGVPSVAATLWKADEETIYYLYNLVQSKSVERDG